MKEEMDWSITTRPTTTCVATIATANGEKSKYVQKRPYRSTWRQQASTTDRKLLKD